MSTVTSSPTSIPRLFSTPTETFLDENIVIKESLVSPSGKRQALVVMNVIQNGGNEHRSVSLLVYDTNTNKNHLVEQIITNSGLGFLMPWPISWSEDEDFLYYTHRLGGGDGCFGENDFFGSDLLKYTLSSESTIKIAPNLGNWVALSPDQTKVAFLTSEGDVIIKDILLGDERKINIDYSYEVYLHPSNLIWSPDNKELLFTIAIDPCNNEENTKHSILKVNATTLAYEVMIQEDSNQLVTIEWKEPNRVLLQDESCNNLWMNLDTGMVSDYFETCPNCLPKLWGFCRLKK
ncbi:MAG: hypothetical protein C0410_01400 [Anaerolinea sp.]|nr:hypothetical protein [Anaerolinea sp.]